MKSNRSRTSACVALPMLALTLSLGACQSIREISQETDREIAAGVCEMFKIVQLPARFSDDSNLTSGELRLKKETTANNAAHRAYCEGD